MNEELADLIENAPCVSPLGPRHSSHRNCIADALRAAVADRSTRVGVLRSLGLNAVAMSDSDCGWLVSASVEAAGAWSTVPDGGWTRDG